MPSLVGSEMCIRDRHARACAHTRPRHRRGVGERPHVRGSVERTASLAVAKTSCRGGQTRWPWRAELPLQGIPSEKAASGGCGPISTNHVALFGLSCIQFYPAPCFGHIPTRYTLFWPPSFYFCLRYEYTICLSYCCCCSHINSSLQCSPWSQHRLQQRWSGKLPQEENK